MQPTSIFTLTVVSNDPYSLDKDFRTRTWGYFFNVKDATTSMMNTETDMSECGYYRYGVVSQIEEGPCPIAEEIQWFEFVWEKIKHSDGRELKQVKKIKKPKIYKNIMFGGLG